MVIDLPVENNRAKYRRNMVVMGSCFKCQEIPAFLIISGGLEGSASASHLYLRHAGRAICWWPLTSSSSACRSARCSRQQQLLPLLLLLPASGRRPGQWAADAGLGRRCGQLAAGQPARWVSLLISIVLIVVVDTTQTQVFLAWKKKMRNYLKNQF